MPYISLEDLSKIKEVQALVQVAEGMVRWAHCEFDETFIALATLEGALKPFQKEKGK